MLTEAKRFYYYLAQKKVDKFILSHNPSQGTLLYYSALEKLK